MASKTRYSQAPRKGQRKGNNPRKRGRSNGVPNYREYYYG